MSMDLENIPLMKFCQVILLNNGTCMKYRKTYQHIIEIFCSCLSKIFMYISLHSYSVTNPSINYPEVMKTAFQIFIKYFIRYSWYSFRRVFRIRFQSLVMQMCVCVCVCARVCACARACVCVCVRACQNKLVLSIWWR
jgi:hypothetical protein